VPKKKEQYSSKDVVRLIKLLPDSLPKKVIKNFPENLTPYLYKYGDIFLAISHAIVHQARSPILENRLIQTYKEKFGNENKSINSKNLRLKNIAINRIIIYAHDVIRGRWKEAEDIILEGGPSVIYNYLGSIKQSWPEGEEVMLNDLRIADVYVHSVLCRRWPRFEAVLLERLNTASFKTLEERELIGILEKYIKNYISERWREVEPIIDKIPIYLFNYYDIKCIYLQKVANKTMSQIEIEKYFQEPELNKTQLT